MTTPSLRQRDLPRVLDELAASPTPDYIDAVLATTARRRQRPAWTFPERWVPMIELVRQPALTSRVAWRAVAMAIVVLALLVAAAAALLLVGRKPLPAPFGPAANGEVAIAERGDIYALDPSTGARRAIVTGPDEDVGPRYSLDGSRIVFERKIDFARSELWVVAADGGSPTRITPEPLALMPPNQGRMWERYEFSPDGQSVLVAIGPADSPGIAIASVDGSGVRQLDVGMPAIEPSYRPPDAREVLFIGRGAEGPGLYTIDLETEAVRRLLTVGPSSDLAGASWSPDGSRISYWRWNNETAGMNARSHVVGADGTGDIELPMPADAVWSAHATWSNDGTRLFIVRGHTAGYEDVRGVVLPADGSSPGEEVAPAGFVETECCAAWMWSPDDTKLLGRALPIRGGHVAHVVIDVEAGTAEATDWTSASDPTWRRVSP